MHYKTLKFNIKIPLNIHNFHFCGAHQSFILTLRAERAENLGIFLTPPPPPPPNLKNESTPLGLRVLSITTCRYQ